MGTARLTSQNRTRMITLCRTRLFSSLLRQPRQMRMAERQAATKKISILWVNSGYLAECLTIFLMILPLCEVKPVWMAIAKTPSLLFSSYEPQQSQWEDSPSCLTELILTLRMGMFYPVKLASLTRTSPERRTESQGIFSPTRQISPGTICLLLISAYCPSLMVLTEYYFSAIFFILVQLQYWMAQLTEMMMQRKAKLTIMSWQSFWMPHTQNTRYWSMKRGSVRVSKMNKKQFGTYTLCSLLSKKESFSISTGVDRPQLRGSLELRQSDICSLQFEPIGKISSPTIMQFKSWQAKVKYSLSLYFFTRMGLISEELSFILRRM